MNRKRLLVFVVLCLFPFSVARGESTLAPDFTLVSTGGEKISLSKLKGRVVLINFFAEWCAPCRKEIPHLNAWHRKYAPDLVILGIDYDNTQKEKAVAFSEKPVLRIEGEVSMFTAEAGVEIKIVEAATGIVLDTLSAVVIGDDFLPVFSELIEQLKNQMGKQYNEKDKR